jgi:hypothetical protein
MCFTFLLGAGSLLYLARRINWLLIEIEEELIYSANRKDADEVFKNDDCHDGHSTEDRFEKNMQGANKGGQNGTPLKEGSYHLRN